jgi:hypothetical protein
MDKHGVAQLCGVTYANVNNKHLVKGGCGSASTGSGAGTGPAR